MISHSWRLCVILHDNNDYNLRIIIEIGKKDDKYLAPPEIFRPLSPAVLVWLCFCIEMR